jgi:predicted RNA-binding protein Jag
MTENTIEKVKARLYDIQNEIKKVKEDKDITDSLLIEIKVTEKNGDSMLGEIMHSNRKLHVELEKLEVMDQVFNMDAILYSLYLNKSTEWFGKEPLLSPDEFKKSTEYKCIEDKWKKVGNSNVGTWAHGTLYGNNYVLNVVNQWCDPKTQKSRTAGQETCTLAPSDFSKFVSQNVLASLPAPKNITIGESLSGFYMVINQAYTIVSSFEAAKKDIKSKIGRNIKSILNEIKVATELLARYDTEEKNLNDHSNKLAKLYNEKNKLLKTL